MKKLDIDSDMNFSKENILEKYGEYLFENKKNIFEYMNLYIEKNNLNYSEGFQLKTTEPIFFLSFLIRKSIIDYLSEVYSLLEEKEKIKSHIFYSGFIKQILHSITWGVGCSIEDLFYEEEVKQDLKKSFKEKILKELDDFKFYIENEKDLFKVIKI